MSPSSKFSMRRGRHGTPRTCVPPPPLPIIPPPPPPVCPPASVGGYVDAYWETEMGPQHYYTGYNGIGEPPDEPSYWLDELLGNPGHRIYVDNLSPTELLVAEVLVRNADGEEATFIKSDVPFDWCTGNFLTISVWDYVTPSGATCTMTIEW